MKQYNQPPRKEEGKNRSSKPYNNRQNRGNRNDYGRSYNLYAPFNFVPLSQKVFFPSWASQISQDIPFSDQLSGTISATLTAETPIFTKNAGDDQLEATFCKLPDGRYFIPATSLKGCIRNVLEILSFGKIAQVNNCKFETKDFKYNQYLTVHTVIPSNLLNPSDASKFQPDLAECIFGYTTSSTSLKGRVQFSHAIAVKGTAKEERTSKSFEAYSPHPSYYPIYAKDGNKWTDRGAQIVGWKRYLIQEVNPKKADGDDEEEKKGTDTAKVKFLKEGAQFKFTIRFHNLKPVELGALLSALTFHGYNDCCYHNIGFAKPYGYGKVKISDPEIHIKAYNKEVVVLKDTDFFKYLIPFEQEMIAFSSDWLNSSQLKELLSMAFGWDKNVGYMSMKEYRIGKRDGLRLKRFSEISPSSVIELNPIEESFENPATEKNQPKSNVPTVSPTIATSKNSNEVDAVCVKENVVRIEGKDYDSKMTGLKKLGIDPKILVGKKVRVEIKQTNKIGNITQVAFIGII